MLNEKIDNKENFYAWKSLVYGRSDPVNWVLLTYNQRSLSAASKGVISDEKHAEIFKDYKDLSFYIYSGDLAQIDLCDKGDFRHGLCFLNGENSPKPTVVTAYYKNLYDSDLKAVSDFLHAPFNLVVFTDKENIDWLRKERGNLPMKIIEKECESFYHSKFLKTYERDYEQDVNKSNSPELYVLSAEKVKFVNQAIDMDPYDSDYFVWCDIDTFRESGYINNNFLSSKFMWKGRMGFAIIEEFTLLEMAEKIPTIQEPKAKASTRNYAIHSVARVAGNVQVGDIAAWRVYNEVWDITRDDMIDNGIHTSNDQRVMGAIALRYPWLVRLEYVDLGMTGK